ncbi:MAG: hypothetical protein ACI4TV_04385 [Paludibacteraceae bacterium]
MSKNNATGDAGVSPADGLEQTDFVRFAKLPRPACGEGVRGRGS